MAERDYYEVLGVARSAGQDEIRKAYRKLAREHHPDVSKAPDAAKKFAEVQNAYDVLSDEQKRRLYDQHGEAGVKGPPPGAGDRAWSGAARSQGFDFDPDELGSVFEAIFGGGARAHAAGGTGGQRRGHRSGRRPREAPEQPPVEHEVRVSFLTAARGGKEHVRISAEGASKSIEVTIPPGIEDGAVLRVPGVVGGGLGPGRDLLLTIRTGAHPIFRRGEHAETGKGLDLYLDVPLTIAEATLGAAVAVPTLDGSAEVRVPAGTSSGRRLRLRGQGLRDARGGQGDLYGVVRIVPPSGDDLTPAERAAIESAAGKTAGVRPSPPWPRA